MKEKNQVKTIRFTKSELNRISLFMDQNPGMDFSTLIRLAVGKFISSPTLNSINSDKSRTDNDNSSKESLWN
jgi:hypothetical protein